MIIKKAKHDYVDILVVDKSGEERNNYFERLKDFYRSRYEKGEYRISAYGTGKSLANFLRSKTEIGQKVVIIVNSSMDLKDHWEWKECHLLDICLNIVSEFRNVYVAYYHDIDNTIADLSLNKHKILFVRKPIALHNINNVVHYFQNVSLLGNQ